MGKTIRVVLSIIIFMFYAYYQAQYLHKEFEFWYFYIALPLLPWVGLWKSKKSLKSQGDNTINPSKGHLVLGILCIVFSILVQIFWIGFGAAFTHTSSWERFWFFWSYWAIPLITGIILIGYWMILGEKQNYLVDFCGRQLKRRTAMTFSSIGLLISSLWFLGFLSFQILPVRERGGYLGSETIFFRGTEINLVLFFIITIVSLRLLLKKKQTSALTT